MKKLTLIAFTLLFAIGTYFSTATTLAVERGDGPCARRCHENYHQVGRHCRELPPALRDNCVREARERLRNCLRNCRD